MDTAVTDVWKWCPRISARRQVRRGGSQTRPHAGREHGNDCQVDRRRFRRRGRFPHRPGGGVVVAVL